MNKLRSISVVKDYIKHAEGSCLFSMGKTKVLCVATVEDKVPPHAEEKNIGWVTAEYSMLPRSGTRRTPRARATTGGRSQEISRLIGRSLRGVVDLSKLGPRSITIDCDVILADGGTRTASINGGMIALALAVRRLYKKGAVSEWPLKGFIGAVSVGVFEGRPVLDLDYEKDSEADSDINVVMTESGDIIEVQGTAEKKSFSEKEFLGLLRLAKAGIKQIIRIQKKTVGALALLFCLVVLQSCSMRRIALRTAADIVQEGMTAFYEEEDVLFAREAMTSHLKLLEGFLKNDPRNTKLLLALSQGFGGYAFLFLEDESPERAKYFYKKARDYGFLALGGKVADTDKAVFSDAPALFWSGYAWGGWANLSRTDPQALADLPKVEAMIRQTETLNPGYFYEGPNLFLGAYYGSRPKIFGGDLEKARKFFETALLNTGRKFLMAQVLYAKYYAVFAQDKDLFQTLLNEVANAPKDILPEQTLSNQVAKEKAKKLLGKIDELF